MGNSESNNSNFNAQQYVRPGINEQEVLGLKNVFDSLEPKDGQIETAVLRRLYRDSYDAPSLNLEIGERRTLTFDQFFAIMSQNMLEKKEQFKGDVQFEEREENATCLFCPQSRNTKPVQTIKQSQI